LREFGITPHVAQNAYATETARRRSAIDGAPPGMRATRSARKNASASGDLRLAEDHRRRQTKFRGLDRVRMVKP
jgi:hypothetical protein